MKVLHVVHGYPPAIGGSEFLAQQVAERFVRDFGDQVTVLTTRADTLTSEFRREGLPTGIEEQNGVTIHRLHVFDRAWNMRQKIASLAYQFRLPGNDYLRTLAQGPIIPELAKKVAASRADVVIANAFPLLHMYDALAGARRANIPIIYLGALHPTDHWGYDRPMIYRAIRQADHYIAHTAFERDVVIAQGIDAAKVSVIGAGVDIAPFRNADGAPMRHRLGLGYDPVILVMAKQSIRKRLDLMLAAMPHIWEAIPPARLVVAGGRGNYTAQLESSVSTLPEQWRERITLLSDFAEADKPALIAASNLLTLPSADESFGIVLLEAWASAKPVVGVGVGAVSTIIENGVDGLHFDYPHPQSLASACIILLLQPDVAARMGLAGLAKVQAHYSWDKIITQLHAKTIAVSRRKEHDISNTIPPLDDHDLVKPSARCT